MGRGCSTHGGMLLALALALLALGVDAKRERKGVDNLALVSGACGSGWPVAATLPVTGRLGKSPVGAPVPPGAGVVFAKRRQSTPSRMADKTSSLSSALSKLLGSTMCSQNKTAAGSDKQPAFMAVWS